MPDIDTSPAALRTLAGAATPGPWRVVTYRTPFSITRHDGTTCSGEHVGRDIATVRHHLQSHAPYPIVTLGIGVTQETPVHFVFIRPEDADYLAAVSPEVVLALLDTIDSLRASLAAAEKERDEALRDAIKFTQKVDAGLVRDEEYLRLHREKMEQYDRRVAAEARAEKAEAERDAAKDEAANFIFDVLQEACGNPSYNPCDGTETWEGDVAGTVYAILNASGLRNEDTGELAIARAEKAEAERDALAGRRPKVLLHWGPDGDFSWGATDGLDVVCVDERCPNDRVYETTGDLSVEVIQRVADGRARHPIDALDQIAREATTPEDPVHD